MFLRINNVNDDDLLEYCNFLIERLRERIENTLDVSKLLKFLPSYTKLVEMYKNAPSLKNVIKSSINLYRVRQVGKNYILDVSREVIPNTPIQYETVMRMVNYGTLDTSAYPIYTEAIDYIADNMQEYYELFMEEGL